MKHRKTTLFAAVVGLAAASGIISIAATAPALAEATIKVGGAAMYPSKNIIQNAINSKDHTTLVAAVKAAGLVDTLQGPGPFTVFAPVNSAFQKLPAGTVANLLKPENKGTLTAVLTYHVVPGKYSAADLMNEVKMGGGKAILKTVEGEALTVEQVGRKLEIVDAKGDKATVTIADVNQSNGIIHVVDTVLLPELIRQSGMRLGNALCARSREYFLPARARRIERDSPRHSPLPHGVPLAKYAPKPSFSLPSLRRPACHGSGLVATSIGRRRKKAHQPINRRRRLFWAPQENK